MPSPDTVIITALPIERDAVLSHLDNYKFKNNYFRGKIQSQKIAVALTTEMGNLEAGIIATKMIETQKPRNIIMLGIAAGINKVALGDVVVAQFCHYYELAKLKTNQTEQRPRQYPTSTELYGKAKNYQNSTWHKAIKTAMPVKSPPPQVHFGPIASGDKVIADDVTVNKLLAQCPELLAIAMEGAGVARAAQHKEGTHFIEIRGISDFADPNKNDNWQARAADAAATFLMTWLRSWPNESSTPSDSSNRNGNKTYNIKKIKNATFN